MDGLERMRSWAELVQGLKADGKIGQDSESYFASALVLEGLDEIAALRQEVEELRRTERAYAVLLHRREAAERRCSSLEARLARVLQLYRNDRAWAGVHDGAVWSRKHAGGRK